MKRQNPRRANGHRRNQTRARVLAAYDTCGICGKPVDKTIPWPHPAAPVIDEIIPISKGGTLTFANSQLAHNACNRMKSDHSQAWARRHAADATHSISDTTQSRSRQSFTKSAW
ncbi:HNH endonuclease [Arcanobacterium haemolyticum]|nr:HNH endonuclease [Arcanobacterium haemolyticum]